MKKRITGIVLTAVLLASMMSFSAFAAGETPNKAGAAGNDSPEAYPVWVCGTQVNEFNCSDILHDGGSVSFVPATETEPARLKLNDATIAAGNDDRALTGIKSQLENLTVELSGTNTIGRAADWSLDNPAKQDFAVLRGIDASYDSAEGEKVYGNLTFKGESGSSLTVYDYEFGILAGNVTFTEDFKGKLTINDYGDGGYGAISAFGRGYYDTNDEYIYTGEGKVTLLGGTYALNSKCIDGINTDGDITIDDVLLTIHSRDEGIDSYRGNVVITGCPEIDISSDDESLEAYKKVCIINCPSVEIVSENDDSVYAGDIVITNSTVNVTARNDYDGLDADTDEDGAGSVTINGGSKVNIHSTDSGIECCSLSIGGEGTEVYSAGGAGLNGDSCGVMILGGENNISITGGTVKFTGDKAAVILRSSVDTDKDPFTHSLPNLSFAGSTVFDTFESMQAVTFKSVKKDDSAEIIYEEYPYVGDEVAKSVTVSANLAEDNTMLNFCVDVTKGSKYYDAVLWAYQKGITKGTDAVHFSSDMAVSRGQAVTFLWNLAGRPVVDYFMQMNDVESGKYYTEAIRWALSMGITNGTSKKTFSPDKSCTVGEMITLLWRFSGSPVVNYAMNMNDVPSGAYYTEAIRWALSLGIAHGTTENTFGPGKICTREKTVSSLYRFCTLISAAAKVASAGEDAVVRIDGDSPAVLISNVANKSNDLDLTFAIIIDELSALADKTSTPTGPLTGPGEVVRVIPRPHEAGRANDELQEHAILFVIDGDTMHVGAPDDNVPNNTSTGADGVVSWGQSVLVTVNGGIDEQDEIPQLIIEDPKLIVDPKLTVEPGPLTEYPGTKVGETSPELD